MLKLMKTITFKRHQKLTTKDIMLLSEVSSTTANRIKQRIKKEFNCRIVTYYFYQKYYCEI